MDLWELFKRWTGWIVIILTVVGILIWGNSYTKPTLKIRLVTGPKASYEYKFGEILKKQIEKRSRYSVHNIVTSGSIENRARLLAGETDIALILSDATSLHNLFAVAPLWENLSYFIVTKNSGINSLSDIRGRSVALGKPKSAPRERSEKILAHMGIPSAALKNTDYFAVDMMTNPEIEAAIGSASKFQPYIMELMKTGRFKLVSLDEVQGIADQNYHFRKTIIPKGIYPGIGQAWPEKPVATISSFVLLFSRKGTPVKMMNTILKSLYNIELFNQFPHLAPSNKIRESRFWEIMETHSAAVHFFNPLTGIERISTFIVHAIEFGVIGILFFILILISGFKIASASRRRKERQFIEECRAIEGWLKKIVKIDQGQKQAKSIRVLKQYHDQAVELKMASIKTVTGLNIEHSRLFAIFMMECSGVIQQIEWKLSNKVTQIGIETENPPVK